MSNRASISIAANGAANATGRNRHRCYYWGRATATPWQTHGQGQTLDPMWGSKVEVWVKLASHKSLPREGRMPMVGSAVGSQGRARL